MSAFDDPLLGVIGISWFREEDYAAIRAVSEDGHKMPSKWKDWLKGAEEFEQNLQARASRIPHSGELLR